MRRFIGTRSTASYRSAVAALQCLSTLDPTLRARRLMSRALARSLLPADLQPLTYAFEELLGESTASARRLIHDWFFYRHLESVSWTDAPHQPKGLLRDATHVGDYVNACPRGVVVASIHMGDYLEGLRRLRLTLSTSKRVFAMRRKEWTETEERAFARVASDDLAVTVLRTGRGAATNAIRELRRGHIVVVLFDLPQRFGRTVEVEFFGRRANFVRGPAEIALLGNADILPIFTHYDAQGVSVAEAMPVIAARSAATGDLARRTAGLAQRLITLAERQIRAHPSQWAHWTFVREFLRADAGGALSG